MPYRDPLSPNSPDKERPEDTTRVASFPIGPQAEDDEYEDEDEVVDPAVNAWLARVMSRHN